MRFDAMDKDGNGTVDPHEYLQWSLKEALARSSTRVIDMFRAWDEDGSGFIDRKEFSRAIRALGFETPVSVIDAVFKQLDGNHTDKLEYAELNAALHQGLGADMARHNLSRAKTIDRSRSGKLTAKSVNLNYVGSKTAALPEMVRLEAGGERSLQEQLYEVITEHSVRVLDLFREWDDDGNGAIDKKELRLAVAALGYDAPKKEVDMLFDSLDGDGSGFIEFPEFKRMLSEKAVDLAAQAAGRVAPSARKKAEAAARAEEEAREEAARAAAERPPARGSAAARKDLSSFLAKNNLKVMNLFREWDENGDGALDRREFHRAIRLLGYTSAERDDIEGLFDELDISGDGHVDFAEMKRALNSWIRGLPTPTRPGTATATSPTSGPRAISTKGLALADAIDAARSIMLGLPRGEAEGGELVLMPNGVPHATCLLTPSASSHAA